MTASVAIWPCFLINSIFERTWGTRAGSKPSTEYWTDLITTVKATHRQFVFMAEAYWDLEWELQQQGFDYCYDKRLYDRFEHGDVEPVRNHLLADSEYQRRLVRFLENHDEPRAAATFPSDKHRAAAVAVFSLPGAKLFHEGQFQGRRTRVTVFLARRPEETPDLDLERFYGALLQQTAEEPFRSGDLDAVRMYRLAGQYELSESAGLVLEKADRSMSRGRQHFRRLVPGARPGPMV